MPNPLERLLWRISAMIIAAILTILTMIVITGYHLIAPLETTTCQHHTTPADHTHPN